MDVLLIIQFSVWFSTPQWEISPTYPSRSTLLLRWDELCDDVYYRFLTLVTFRVEINQIQYCFCRISFIDIKETNYNHWNSIERHQISAALEFPADLLSIVGLEVGFVHNNTIWECQTFYPKKIWQVFLSTFARLKVFCHQNMSIFLMLQVLGRRWSAALSMLLVKTMISLDHLVIHFDL